MTRVCLVMFTLALVGTACGSSPSSNGPTSDAGNADVKDGGVLGDAVLAGDAGADASKAIMMGCAAVAASECAKLESCSSLVLQSRYGSVATCESRTQEICENALSTPATGNTASQVSACAMAYAGWGCTDFLNAENTPKACIQPTGKLPNGMTCAFPGECTTGFCAIEPHAVCGACADVPKAGDSCANLTSCGQNLHCFAASKVCGEVAALAAQCDEDTPCGAHLSCIGAVAATHTQGTCQASAAKGATCDPTLVNGPGCDFYAGLTCDVSSKQCVSITVSATGGACGLDDGSFATCGTSGTCSTSEAGAAGTCTVAAADGAACSTQSTGPGCLWPARCITATETAMTGTCQKENESPICK
jgi:hypothetical protein